MARNPEGDFQDKLIKELERRLPGCIVLKNDSSYRQGIPDLIVLYKDRYAMLEAKASANSQKQPNQDWYVGYFGEWVYSAFVYPENREEVLDAVQRSLQS